MEHVFQTYARYPLDLVDGHDWYLTDQSGQNYLDFTSGIGVCSLGYSNSAIVAAVVAQAGKVWHTSNLYESQLQDQVAAKLAGPGKLAFFCNSGTEANEAALKLARKYTGKPTVLAFNNSFHGRTYGSLSMTGNPSLQAGFGPLVPEIEFANFNDVHALEQVTEQTAAVILEVVQGEGGVYPADREWLTQLQAKCRQTGALLIIDEVQSGMGRTGYKFAYEGFGLDPDLVTVAKALGNGLPIGALIGKAALGSAFGPGTHGTTFGGNRLALASANAVLDQMDAAFFKTVREHADQVWRQLQPLTDLPVVTSVTGKGLMIGIHLADSVNVEQVVVALQKDGLLTLSAKHNTLRLLPPLVMTPADLETGVNIIKAALSQI